VWNGVDPVTRAALATGIVQSWLQQASQFTPQQFYAGGWTTPTAVPVPGGNAYDGVFPDWVWYMIPRFTFIGVDPSIVAQLAAWAQTIWPNADWTADLDATCSWQNNQPNTYILCALAQNAPVPDTFQATYTELQGYISAFQSTINASWNGSKGNTLWSADALNANCNNGLKLLKLGNAAQTEVNALKGLGVKAVTVCIAFPILDQDFYTFNGDPGDYASILAFYQAEAAAIHGAGLKMIVEASTVDPGTSGMNVTGYYASLSDDQFTTGRQQNALTIAQVVKPDYINLNTEPQTDLVNTGKTNEYGNAAGYTAMNQSIISGLHAAGVTIPVGCGVDTWERDPTWVTDTLAIAGLDFFDLHTYPVNLGLYLPRLIKYTDMAIAANIPVGVSEAWELKESDTEWSDQALPVSAVYARDSFSFWAPLDQAMLTSLVDFANWKGLVYMSAFWSRYLLAYLDYATVGSLPPAQVTSMAQRAASAALAADQTTITGLTYRNLIQGVP